MAALLGVCVHHHPHLIYPLLAAALAIFGAWTALDLFGRARRHGARAQRRWVALSAVAMGVSIWSMHFIAMLGFDPGAPVSYDIALTIASLLLAIGGTAIAFWITSLPGTSWWRIVIGGLVMGLSIGAMHYVGMSALRTAAMVGYRPEWVAASVIVAFLASAGALTAARWDGRRAGRALAAGLLGLGIVAMHYTAMAALILTPGVQGADPSAIPALWLALGVANLTLLLLLLGLGASLVDQKQVLLQAMQAGRLGYWEFDIARDRLTLSETGRSLLGFGPEAPFAKSMVASLLTPESAAERETRLLQAIAQVSDYEADYEMRDGRWLEVRGKMLADGSGRAERLVGTIQDVTAHWVAFMALKKSEARQRILINELNHRVKNTLAKVLSIATLSARKSESLEGFSKGFRARLMSLSATHDLLTREVWEGTDIRNVLDAELAPFDRDQYRLTGPALWLQAETVLNLGLIIHELATNAAKYGGLSQTGGCIDIRWTVDAGLMLLSWRETGGPPVQEPTHRGFGSRLVEASTKEARFSYPPTGFEADLLLVLAERAAAPLDI